MYIDGVPLTEKMWAIRRAIVPDVRPGCEHRSCAVVQHRENLVGDVIEHASHGPDRTGFQSDALDGEVTEFLVHDYSLQLG